MRGKRVLNLNLYAHITNIYSQKKLKSTEYTWGSVLSMSHSKGLGVNPLRSKRTTLHMHKYFHIHVDILTTVGGVAKLFARFSKFIRSTQPSIKNST